MKTFANYLGRYGKTQLWKFGETTDITQRKHNIRKDAKKVSIKSAENFNYVEVSTMANSKAQSVLIESIIRAIFETEGYKLEKNDHFRTNKKKADVLADYHKALAKASKIIGTLYNE